MTNGMQGSADDLDRRVRRTRELILEAFVGLVLDRRYDQIRTAEVIAAAGVGRSTFYEHFRSKEEVLLAAVEPILLPIANAAAGRGAKAHVRSMLDHVWERRTVGRVVLDSRAFVPIQRKLAAMIEARIENDDEGGVPPAVLAMSAAAGQLAMLRMWIGGEAACSSDTLARQMIAFARLLPPHCAG